MHKPTTGAHYMNGRVTPTAREARRRRQWRVAPAEPRMPAPLTEADIARVVDHFYDAVQAHPRLGPVFAPAVHDWPDHKATLVRFWSSIALKTASYRGNPMALHRPHPIDAGHFADWLALWQETVRAELPAEHAAQFVDHAQRIARSLMYGLGIDASRRPLGLPLVSGS